ncbi:fucose mutarotase-like [Dysidea avara]|uniref:fucose mutarotase-like n=1 Tax=Dysidea avara TaxID=196820 RepID=UPI0033191D66
MDLVPNDKARELKTPVWDEYKKLMNAAEGKEIKVNMIERFEFYEVAKKVFAVVATGEGAPYGNIILTKGVFLLRNNKVLL